MRGANLIRNACALAAAAVLTGCATMAGGGATSLGLLRMALATPVATLSANAEHGDARSQFALSIVYQYGLYHTPRDGGEASRLRQKAMARRGTTSITQYIPGLNGAPGRTAIINVPEYGVTAFEARESLGCASALDAGQDTEAAFRSCRDQATYFELKPQWERARAG